MCMIRCRIRRPDRQTGRFGFEVEAVGLNAGYERELKKAPLFTANITAVTRIRNTGA
jgi:hypothetical protein